MKIWVVTAEEIYPPKYQYTWRAFSTEEKALAALKVFKEEHKYTKSGNTWKWTDGTSNYYLEELTLE